MSPTIIFVLLSVFYVRLGATNCGLDYDAISMKNFEIKKIGGKWFEIQRTENDIEEDMDCGEVHIKVNESNSLLMDYHHVDIASAMDSQIKFNYTPAIHHKVAHFITQSSMFRNPVHSMVIHTDYDSYAILAACYDFTLAEKNIVWVYGRHKQLAPALQTEVENILRNRNIDHSQLMTVIQEDEKCLRGASLHLQVSLLLFALTIFINKLL